MVEDIKAKTVMMVKDRDEVCQVSDEWRADKISLQAEISTLMVEKKTWKATETILEARVNTLQEMTGDWIIS